MEIRVLDQTLKCPRCGHDYIHQVWTDVWEREEDAADGIHCCVTRDSVSVDKDAVHENPSERRQATEIMFQCEQCARYSPLAILQHKGHTLVKWETRERGKE
jgi:hypothetical protein